MITWERLPEIVRAQHAVLVDGVRCGWWISATQHPTALRPYIVHRPNGTPVGPNHHYLKDAKAALLAAMQEEAP
jgi:hypothetical protein